MTLTLFIVPIEGVSIERLVESFIGIDYDVKILGEDRNFNEEVKTEWKLYMFANEIISVELNAAIPVFIKVGFADIYRIYKIEKKSFSIAPRLFRSEIQLKKDCLLPVNVFAYKIDTILNGFIL